MSDVIELKQWAGKTVTPKDDACMYDAMLGDSGYITGCDLISLGSGQIKIGTGRGVIKGRQFVILEHTINVPLSESDVLPGRVYIHMDLSAADPITIMSETAATLSELVQEDDCNITNGIYEIELGTYMASTVAISDLTKTIQPVSGYKELKEFMDDSMGGCTFSVQSDGAYVTYTPPGGADPVTKKLGSSTVLIAGFGSYPIGVTSAATATTDLVNLRSKYLADNNTGTYQGSLFVCNKDYKSMTVYASTAHSVNHALGFYDDGTYDVILNRVSASSDVTVDISAYSMIGFVAISDWSGTGFRSATVKFEP